MYPPNSPHSIPSKVSHSPQQHKYNTGLNPLPSLCLASSSLISITNPYSSTYCTYHLSSTDILLYVPTCTRTGNNFERRDISADIYCSLHEDQSLFNEFTVKKRILLGNQQHYKRETFCKIKKRMYFVTSMNDNKSTLPKPPHTTRLPLKFLTPCSLREYLFLNGKASKQEYSFGK